MDLTSGLYEGWVRHRRFAPRPHAFRYRVFLVYLDLAELPRPFAGRWLWSHERPNVAAFRRRDYLGDPDVPLDTAVRDVVEARTGARPAGPIRLLTHLRYFGYCFNPVSFYYCFDPSGQQVETIVAEITNTPWRERHAYVLPRSRRLGTGALLRFRFGKEFHVSPFLDMNIEYDWRFTAPGRQLAVHMVSEDKGRKLFDATMVLARREMTGPAMARVLVRYPMMTAAVIGGIHWQALRLWWRGTPFHVHPKKRKAVTA